MRSWIKYIVAGALFLGAFAVLYGFDPLKAGFFPKCPLYQFTGLYCPGCGSLRALHRLFHGNICGAMAMNPLMVVSLPFLGLLVLRPKWAAKPWVPLGCLIVLLLYGIVRNIPVGPFTVLAPH